jgi:outer membrane protein assembly factor BamB
VELRNRVLRILHLGELGILATDVAGELHLLDEDLNIVRSSSSLPGGQPTYAVTTTDRYVITKDKRGGISRWALPSLDLLDHLDADALCDRAELMPGEEPSPTINRGIGVWQDKVYVNNGYLQLVIIDLPTFTVERIVPSMSESYLEWLSFDRPDRHAVTDKQGRLFLGDVSTLEFPVEVRVDDRSNLHRARWDERHGRFWLTQDSGSGDTDRISNGIVTLSEDGKITGSLLFATDDVEALEFTADYRTAYVGGFDGELHKFDNTEPAPRIVQTIQFGHNIIDITVGRESGRVFVLTQDGAIVALDEDGTAVARAPFRRQCVWDLQSHPDRPGRILAGTDEGVTELLVDTAGAPSSAVVRVVAQHRHNLGLTRRVVPLRDGGWLGVTRDNNVYRSTAEGELAWRVHFDTRLFTASIDPSGTKVLLSANSGGVELDAETGTLKQKIDVGGVPVWAGTYAPNGDRLLGRRDGVVFRFAADSQRVLWSASTGEDAYSKRLFFVGERLLVTGGENVRELDPETGGTLRVYMELLDNTAEDAVSIEGRMYISTYGAQLGVFSDPQPAGPAEPEVLGIIEPLPDFAKALHEIRAADDTPYLLVGGRGGWLRTYRLDEQGPQRIRDLWLIPDAGTDQ